MGLDYVCTVGRILRDDYCRPGDSPWDWVCKYGRSTALEMEYSDTVQN